MEKIVLVTGGFDPVHRGHISMIESARALGDRLIVGVNSDRWLAAKKGRPFMQIQDRKAVLSHLRDVSEVIEFDDTDGSARDAIYQIRRNNPECKIIFANGGDRNQTNIPEMDIKDVNLTFEFGVGGSDKPNSSSWILEQWRAPRTDRPWGAYRVLFEPGPGLKLKELTVEPHCCLSMQKHAQRSEFWFVYQGTAHVYTLDSSTDADLIGTYAPHQWIFISRNQWHMLCNEQPEPLRLIEIQYGDDCSEQDILRQNMP